jgi:hypothetical protein
MFFLDHIPWHRFGEAKSRRLAKAANGNSFFSKNEFSKVIGFTTTSMIGKYSLAHWNPAEMSPRTSFALVHVKPMLLLLATAGHAAKEHRACFTTNSISPCDTPPPPSFLSRGECRIPSHPIRLQLPMTNAQGAHVDAYAHTGGRHLGSRCGTRWSHIRWPCTACTLRKKKRIRKGAAKT